jgi:hypothetical protein
VRRGRQWLRKCGSGEDDEQQSWDSHNFEITV